MPELSEFERIAYADQCTNTSEIISVKALDNMILIFSILSVLIVFILFLSLSLCGCVLSVLRMAAVFMSCVFSVLSVLFIHENSPPYQYYVSFFSALYE